MTILDIFDILRELEKAFFFLSELFMRFLLIVQAIIAILLIVSILLQNRGSGLGSAFGSDFGGYYTKRGIEKFLMYATVVLGGVFLIVAMMNVRYAGGV